MKRLEKEDGLFFRLNGVEHKCNVGYVYIPNEDGSVSGFMFADKQFNRIELKNGVQTLEFHRIFGKWYEKLPLIGNVFRRNKYRIKIPEQI